MLIEKLHSICENKSCQREMLQKAVVKCHNICTMCIKYDLLEDYPALMADQTINK